MKLTAGEFGSQLRFVRLRVAWGRLDFFATSVSDFGSGRLLGSGHVQAQILPNLASGSGVERTAYRQDEELTPFEGVIE